MKITMYTDGSSRGNPGPGGWGAVLLIDNRQQTTDNRGGIKTGEVIELGGREDLTTNNRMELVGTIMGLRAISKEQPATMEGADEGRGQSTRTANHHLLSAVEVCTDSQYVKKGMTEWIQGWIKKGWKGSTKKDVLNRDLWEQLLHEETRLKESGVVVTWTYVRGHNGDLGNERADTIATACADNANNLQLYRGRRSEYPFF